ncbi:hypothetical protein [Salmonella enterica]|uniref:hypothetical protein n=1 Tax=Salmonella enterica TaxID=28901 RepID=UPI0006D4AF0B|nr:hypothetical protein [Salmonella enterica]ECD7660130.1 hypothetical protein [Salmonella enterica subsp. enterica serovar Newport]CUR90331.1 Eaa1 [Salmonella enterica subsp. enterica serovar Weltevreden]
MKERGITDGLTMNQLAERNAEHVTTIAALEARCAALVAENAGLKYQEPAGYHVIKECGKVGCSVATLEEAEKTRDFWNKKWTIRPYFYSAAPAPVVPEEMPKGLADQIVSLLAHNIGDKFLAQKIWSACRAAMLQGSKPVSNRDELLYAKVKAVADLYALYWKSGEVVTYTPNPEKATIWLNNYSGTCVQEYVKLERLQEALAGNSPVIPDGYALVPVEPTDEMIAAAMECDDVVFDSKDPTAFCVQFREIYCAMVDTAPKPEQS